MIEKASAAAAVQNDIHTLDSKITLITQKLQTIEKNMEVIGRTMIALNERIKKLESSKTDSPLTASGKIDHEQMQKLYATKQELNELKYVLNSINPLEYAKIGQVRELIEETLSTEKTKKYSDPDKEDTRGLMEKI
ncbi:hypothetical protein HY993_04660 [Candidatus Micrarchaeota archaeon]|nr:hypothetical protein [Candidatus Micrarchaeota archaeon]